MTPTRAVIRAGLPGRLGILGAILVLCSGARLLGLDDRWEGSDAQIFAAMVASYGLVPIFAAMLGGALVHGEHAPWSFALARPISRRRWVMTCLAMDVATLYLALLTVNVIVGSAPRFGNEFTPFLPLPATIFRSLTTDLVVSAYVAAAVGASRGHSKLRALPVGMAYCGVVIVMASVCIWAATSYTDLFLFHGWYGPSQYLFRTWAPAYSGTSYAFPIAVVGSLGHILARTMARAPVPIHRREMFGVFGGWCLAVCLPIVVLQPRAWAIVDAPVLARRGDAALTVPLDIDSHEAYLVLRERNCDDCFSRSPDSRDRWDERWLRRFEDVPEGSYRLCSVIVLQVVHAGLDEHSIDSRRLPTESCVDIELVAGENRVETSFDPRLAVPSSGPLARDHGRRDPFERLPRFRTVAWSLLRLTWRLRGLDDKGRPSREGW